MRGCVRKLCGRRDGTTGPRGVLRGPRGPKNMGRSSEIYAQDDKLINICLNRCTFLPPVFIIDQTWRENPTNE